MARLKLPTPCPSLLAVCFWSLSVTPVLSHPIPDPALRAVAFERLPEEGLLLITDQGNGRIMAFSPLTGDLVDPDFIPSDPANLTGPVEALLSSDGLSVLVVDQAEDAVQQYDVTGAFLGTFAPAGGVDLSLLQSSNGIELTAKGNLLATVGGGANARSVAEFDTHGNYVGNFVDSGLQFPVDVFAVVTSAGNLEVGQFLVSNAAPGFPGILHYDASGVPVGQGGFADVADCQPAQLAQAANGNILVVCLSGADRGVLELDPTGGLVGMYQPPELDGLYRGVFELPNGNILATTEEGVHELDRLGNLVETKFAANARYISWVRRVSPSPVVDIPTVSRQGLVLLGILMAACSIIRIRDSWPGV